MTPRLCIELLEDPQEVAFSYNCKGYFYKIVAALSAAALAAIFTGALAIYLGAVTASGWALLPLIASIGCVKGLDLWKAGNEQFEKASLYSDFADRYNEIKDWSSEQIREFFLDQRIVAIDQENDAYKALIEKSPDQPLKTLLPLIARCEVLNRRFQEEYPKIDENERIAEEHHLSQEDDLELKHILISIGLLEKLAFSQLTLSMYLQNLTHPTTQYILEKTPRGTALKIKGEDELLGLIKTKDPVMRLPDYFKDRDPVFFIREDHPEDYLCLDEMMDNQPRENRRLIFDPLH